MLFHLPDSIGFCGGRLSVERATNYSLAAFKSAASSKDLPFLTQLMTTPYHSCYRLVTWMLHDAYTTFS